VGHGLQELLNYEGNVEEDFGLTFQVSLLYFLCARIRMLLMKMMLRMFMTKFQLEVVHISFKLFYFLHNFFILYLSSNTFHDSIAIILY